MASGVGGWPTDSDENLGKAVQRIAAAEKTGQDWLDLGDLGLVECPREIARLDCLRHLSLGNTRFLPLGAGFTPVRVHSAGGLRLTRLQHLASCPGLKSLYLGGCHLITQLDSLEGLGELETLDLRDTSVIDLCVIRNFGNLTDLSLSSTPIKDVTHLGGLNRLETLDLGDCVSLPHTDALAHLAELVRLNLAGCTALRHLPPFQPTSKLVELDISTCPQVTDLAPIKHLTRIMSLTARHCLSLTSLEDIGTIPSLVTIDTSHCLSIIDLLPLASQTSLTSLSIQGCRSIKNVDIYATLPGLRATTELNLNGCESVESIEPLSHLHGLEQLSLMACRTLSDLGPLSGHPALRRLDVRQTAVADLSPLLTVPRLEWLGVSGPNVQLPDSLRGTTGSLEILAWWRSNQAAEGATIPPRPLLEVKLLIVGQGEVGKSHLRERLFGGRGLKYYNHALKPTKSFDPVKLIFPANPPSEASQKGETDVTVRAWDFGGQPELHASHRFFLGSQRCFYLLVLAADRPPNGDGPDSNRLNYWLRLIAYHGRSSAGKKAPVLIVVTRNDEGKANPAAVREAVEDARRADYFGANVVEVVEGFGWRTGVERTGAAGRAVSERHEGAAEKTLAAIRTNLPTVPDLWDAIPVEYHEGRKFIEEAFDRGLTDRPMSRAYLAGDTLGEFTDLFRDKAGTVTDEDRIAFRNVCLGQLQHLGVVHWVREFVGAEKDSTRTPPEPAASHRARLTRPWEGREIAWSVRNTAFNPEWVKWPVYDLLWPKHVCERPGVVPDRVIDQMLAARAGDEQGEDLFCRLPFSDDDRERVLDLLTECKLAFDTVGLGGLLVPDLLTTAAVGDALPAGAWTYSAPFLPERVFLRFVAEVYRSLTRPADRCDRNRVVMTLAGHRVVIEARYSPRGHTWPSLSIRSESGGDLPKAVADSFRRDIDRLFADEGFDPADHPLEQVGDRPAAGNDRFVFLCNECPPAGLGQEPEYEFTIVYDGVDLAATRNKQGRYPWKKQQGLRQLRWLIQNAGRDVSVEILDRIESPNPERFASPSAEPQEAARVTDPFRAKLVLLSMSELKLLQVTQEAELVRLDEDRKEWGSHVDERLDAAIHARAADLRLIAEVIEDKQKPELEDAMKRVQWTLKAAVQELHKRMSDCGFAGSELKHFSPCHSSAKRKRHFSYPHTHIEWRTEESLGP